jgi:hypothetical protein
MPIRYSEKYESRRIMHQRYLVYLSISLPTYISIYLPTYISIYLSIYLSTYLYIYLSTYLSIYRSIYISIYIYIDLSIYLSIDLSIYLPVYRSIYLSICVDYIYMHTHTYPTTRLCMSVQLSIRLYVPVHVSVHSAIHQTMFFWVVTPCRLVSRYQRFGEMYCICLQGCLLSVSFYLYIYASIFSVLLTVLIH